MFKSRNLTYFAIFMLCTSLIGCAALQRKFVRKKKKKEEAAPIVTTFDYSRGLRVEELYKKRFIFWKSWQEELIFKIGAGQKKRTTCYDNILLNLRNMQGYLAEAKSQELAPFIKRIEDIGEIVEKKNLSKNEQYRMKQVLEQSLRQIDKRFQFSEVKDSLELRK